MAIPERPRGQKAAAADYDPVEPPPSSAQWPMTVRYGGDVNAPPGRSALCEYSFGRAEEFPASPVLRANASKGLLLVDSVRLTRECLSHLLAAQLPDFEIVSVAHAQQASECGAFRPDITLLNLGSTRLDDRAAYDDIAAVVAATRRAPVLLLSEHGEPEEESRAAEAGMAGLFPSRCSVSLLIAAIHLVVAGGQFHIPSSASPTRARLQGNGARR